MGSASPSAPSGQTGGVNPLYAAMNRKNTNGTPLYLESGVSRGNNHDAVPATALGAPDIVSPFGPTGQKKTALGS